MAISTSSSPTTSTSTSRPRLSPDAAGCAYKGIQVACGPPGLDGGKNILYHNNGDGTFTDVSQKSGMWETIGTYALSVSVSDIDNDGWPDIYVANDSTAATFYQNQKNGTFKDMAIEAGIAYSPDGKPQAGMGVSIGDFNRDGLLDIVKTNFAGDTDSLYLNLGDGTFEDHTYLSGLGVNTRYLGWGVGFFDMDNDGWLDILISNGHVYPEVDGTHIDAPYAQHKYLYRNLRNGQFEEVTTRGGPGINDAATARGCAFGDYDNDGDLDIVVNCVNSLPQLLRCDAAPATTTARNWIKIRTIGTKANRSGIGARITVTTQARRQALHPDRRSPQRRQLLLPERPPHTLRPRPCPKSRHRRNPLAIRYRRHTQRLSRQPSLRSPGRWQGSEDNGYGSG